MAYLDQETLARLLEKAAESADPIFTPDPEEESYHDAFKKIERLVKVRDRSESEIRRRLEQSEFEPKAIEWAIARAKKCSYLDDARFADVLVRSRLRAGKGLAGIVRELKSNGIDPDSIPGFPDEYLSDAPSQFDAAYALLCRKPPRAKNTRQAAYAKLVRAGYPASVASDVTRKWFESRQDQ